MLEKRRYPSGRTYRIAVGFAEYDAGDSLVGYAATINSRHFHYGTVDSGTVECGSESELPVVDLTIAITPQSRVSSYRAAVGISEVLIRLGQGTDWGCFFDAEAQTEQEWIIYDAPAASQCRPSDLGSSFIPDVAGDYVLGWRLSNSVGADVDTLTLVAVEDHQINYASGTVVPEGPGICWDAQGFWYVDWGGLRKVRANGSGLDYREFPIPIVDASGVCCRGAEAWVSGGDGLGGLQLFSISPGGGLADSVPITCLATDRAVLACDTTFIWIGEWQGTGVHTLGPEQEIIGFFEIPDSIGVITDLAYDGEFLWISAEEPDGHNGGLIRMTTGGEVLGVGSLEFVRPMGVAFDGSAVVVLDGSAGGITNGTRVVKLTIP